MSNRESLFQPIDLPSGVTLKNRVLMAPMTNFLSNDDGSVSDKELRYYERRSEGVSAVITACANVNEAGKGFDNEIGVHRDDLIPGLKRLAKTIHEKDAKAILQIFHGGRMAPPHLVPNEDVVSASAVASPRPGTVEPRAMTEEEIQQTIKDFGEATRRAIEAGFDGVEIHGANTYLLQQFFSPHSNRRDDQWGGEVRDRMNFPLAVIEAVKNAVKEHATKSFIIGYRLSPEEKEEPGITMEDTLQFVDVLKNQEMDYLHISLSQLKQGSMRDEEDTIPVIDRIQERVGETIPVMGVGSLHTPEDVEQALETVPFISLGRELLMEPDWMKKLKANEESSIRTAMRKQDQEDLVIPEPMWTNILSVPNWFVVEE
ncbi:NADH-dependent flavin oxidoreductase [Pontibacillus halophilus JSM 076056 = DSM 19796]|uniref:NADH-dependent flavin oxidoreductase n=1 Tax=Pontibacillus halophilus JSM 076056 = DSM 19796 TaxID=1385510 RepID=A0A0A5GP40_9BACI|nr:NADH-dependent flavin oxidoreductase [Pontibacillus halophilus]KGX93764.1 NADH-dependent flavin oxidoreductase [Pontibacillus halophilus JSM 076056 = DSM 19796]